MSDLAIDFSSLDESTGDGIGSGAFDSSIGLSGDSLDELDATGSTLQLDTSQGITGVGTFDAPTGIDDFNLSGASESTIDPFSDSGVSENGAGSAGSYHVLSPSSSVNDAGLLASAFSKFGSVFSGLLTHTSGAAPYAVSAGAPPLANPNLGKTTGITSKHAVLAILVIGGIVVVMWAAPK